MLDTLGTFVNQGTIEANGPNGSNFTIDVPQGTAGNFGAFINEGKVERRRRQRDDDRGRHERGVLQCV